MPRTVKINATITDAGKTPLTLRLFVKATDKRRLLLQTGKQPKSLFNVVVL